MIKSMTADELKKELENKSKLVLVDCREQAEWDAGHIPEAIFIPLSNFPEGHKVLKDKSARIVLQCRSGKRSLQAANFLAEQGYEDLTNLEGGILDWQSIDGDII